MKKFFTVTLYIFLYSWKVYTQDATQVIPPSPNAANLYKFVDIPVGKYTGIPQTSIPIWTIEQGKIRVPITLDYHSGGIKVSEIASWVGLGWSLNAGGAVSRSVLGKADETMSGFLNVSYPSSDFLSWQYNTTYNKILDPNIISGYFTGNIDGQPDMFYFNYPGHSGKFVFNKAGNINLIPYQNLVVSNGGTQTVNFNIPPNSGSETQFVSWTIISEDGTKYIFDNYEKTISQSYVSVNNSSFSPSNPNNSINTWQLSEIINYQDTIYFSYEDNSYSYDLPVDIKSFVSALGSGGNYPSLTPDKSYQKQYIIEKRLKSIQYKNGTIQFNTSSTTRADLIGQNALNDITVSDKNGNVIKKYLFNYEYLSGNNYVDPASLNVQNENNYYQNYNIQSPPNSGDRRLMLMNVTEADKNNAKMNNGYSFEYFHDYGLPNRLSTKYDYWGYSNNNNGIQLIKYPVSNDVMLIFGKDPNLGYMEQGTLNKITYPTGGYSTFDFELNTATNNAVLPLVGSQKQGASLTIGYGRAYDRLEYPYDVINGVKVYYADFSVDDLGGNAQITLDVSGMPGNLNSAMRYYIVNTNNPNVTVWSSYINVSGATIVLPNGSYRIYHYPEVQYIADNSSNVLCSIYLHPWVEEIPKPFPYPCGGIRVKQLSTLEPLSNKLLIKNYTYDHGYISNGPTLWYDYAETTNGTSQYKAIDFNSFYPLTQTHGSYVGYQNVTETTLDNNNQENGRVSTTYITSDYSSDNNNNFSDMAFHSSFDIETGNSNLGGLQIAGSFLKENANQFPIIPPFAPVDSRDWLRGMVLQEDIYQTVNGQPALLKSTTNNYTYKIDNVSRGYISMFTKQPNQSGPAAMFDISSGYIFPTQTIVQDFSGNNVLQTVQTSTFSEKSLLPIKTIVNKSNGDMLYKFNVYPKEYIDASGFIKKLIDNNIVNNPVEEVTAVNKHGQLYITGGKINKYLDNAFGQLDETLSLETNTPLTLSNFKFSLTSQGDTLPSANLSVFTPDSHYVQVLKVDSYDQQGNLRQLHKKQDMNITYLWGYNGQYPVAKIVGSDYTNTTVNGIISNQNVLDNPADDNTLRNYLNALRSIPNAQVTTFTYKPLVGMTSQTDPAGKTLYYQYDGLSRLAYILDNDRNVIKKFCYNYAGQPENCTDVVYTSTKSQSFTRNNCSSDQIAGSITYTATATSTLSQADADNKAQSDIDANGQTYANANTTCTQVYYNTFKSQTFTKNNCATGGAPSSVTYTVTAGAYTSTISQGDADAKAQNDINNNGQNYANNNGYCTFTSAQKSGTFTKNNCATGGTGSGVTYTVAAGAYSSTTSQADADTKAQNDVNNNGQTYANNNGYCTFYSVQKSGTFTKNNCATGGTPSSVTYTVSAGAYSSTTSQADADAKAQNDVNNNGQTYANNNGYCTFYSVQKSGTFTKNNCATGGTPSSVTYTVTAGAYTSTTSQADADAKAQNDVNNNGQTYANNNGYCTFYSVQKSGIFTKNNCAAGGTPSSVTYTVSAGAYTSTTSQADADTKAQNDVNNNGQTYANNNGYCTFYSVQKSGIFTKNNCAAGGTPSSVTYTVPAGAYTSTISQSDADAKAQSDVNNNGQTYANNNGYCTFYSVQKSGIFTENNCAAGGTGSSVTYTVSAGAYTSTTSQADADAKAQNDVNNNGQTYANNNGYCTFYSVQKSGTFTKNNCATGGTGSSVTYTVAARAYTSTTSQADADTKAQNDVNNNGQTYANNNGYCTFYNVVKSQSFTRNNCGSRYTGSTVTYTVPARTYSSTISQTDADNKAQSDINANGQTYANNNGICTLIPCSFTMSSGYYSPSNSISNDGTTASGYLVFYPTSNTMTQGHSYQIATINGSCVPSGTRVITTTSMGRALTVTIYSSGIVTVGITSGSSINSSTSITLSISYLLNSPQDE